ncbi:lysophospholipid acyltransferase family protein [Frigidibacter oleivorans]|uniref:lysophospholipid acyltransferase family protein n=1 Tax=Frigidibacter oleivorans TaxID=2487129 RepID=UPI000F8CEE83|nr:lysophospholipid acyltransferase family protein [Frigidibacter oleivorans]
MRWLLSLVFSIQIYAMMALMAVWFTPQVFFRREAAYDAVQTWCRWVRWSAERMLGLRTVIRGTVPTGEVLIAAKHQSFLDIILIVSAVPRPKFIMKRELLWAPILGWYAIRIGCVPVHRGRRGQAIQQMLADVETGRALPGQLIIYPQGTRVAPGAAMPYKPGTGALYSQLGQTCVPAATNVGLFWPRRGVLRRPGLAVVEFLPPIPPGLPLPEFMARLESEVETASDDLMAEAGFRPGRG